MQTSHPRERVFYLDFLRAFACLSVIMIHASVGYALLQVGSLNFWLGNILGSCARAAVPLFAMISGALMLDENYAFSVSKTAKHIIRMICFYLFWSTAYSILFYVWMPLNNHEPIDPIQVVLAIVKGHYHLWFIPMIIGLYLLVPLLRLWVKRENRRYVEYFLVLFFIFTSLIPQFAQTATRFKPVFQNLQDISNYFNMRYVSGFSVYFILGWYLHQFGLPFKKIFTALGIGGLLATIFGTYALIVLTGAGEFLFYGEFTVNVLFYAVMLFELAHTAFRKPDQLSPLLKKPVLFLSRHSLGIYAVHATVLTMISSPFFRFPGWIALPCIFSICLMISAVLAYLLSKLPLIKKLV